MANCCHVQVQNHPDPHAGHMHAIGADRSKVRIGVIMDMSVNCQRKQYVEGARQQEYVLTARQSKHEHNTKTGDKTKRALLP